MALTSAAPLSQIGGGSADVRVAGAADDVPVQAAVRRVSSGYNALLGVPLVAGRDFDANDRGGAEPVAIINRGPTRGDELATVRIDGGTSETLVELAANL
mgnify:CR=1 FL=1